MTERWKDIPNYEGIYQVSDLGRVKNSHGRVMSPAKSGRSGNYRRVGLKKDGINKNYCVHRLVYRTFCGEIPEYMHIAHLDGDASNNALSNLDCASPSQNERHKVLHGTLPMGEKHPKTNLTKEQALEIYNSSKPHKVIAREYGVSERTIRSIRSGDTWARAITPPPDGIAMNNNDVSELVFYAFRYGLGRQSYAVSTIANLVIRYWGCLDESHKKLIIKEINEAIERGGAGMDIDVQTWQSVIAAQKVGNQ